MFGLLSAAAAALQAWAAHETYKLTRRIIDEIEEREREADKLVDDIDSLRDRGAYRSADRLRERWARHVDRVADLSTQLSRVRRWDNDSDEPGQIHDADR